MSHKNLLKRVSFIGNRRVKRNVTLFDAGLHTLHLKPNEGEKDMEFVTRFLIQYLEGCKQRGGKRYRKFYISNDDGRDDIVTWGVEHE